ncbi:MAG: ribosome assembly cofactor RimP [Bacteroidetes bacterium HGW-Bacteroidetes-6]|jgi:ribosome maturation factor RimP|nr:MAG: ribosome assembly cofactor RimP [Bacteroidetes bacterium HGW-Bacteroidetes-6]
MISAELIKSIVDESLGNGSLFAVSAEIRKGNKILVMIDGDNGVKVEDCIKLSKEIESHLNRDEEDFELEVSSYGIGSPLVMIRQYINNVGRNIQVKLFDGNVITGKLIAADADKFTIERKNKKNIDTIDISYSDCEQTQITVSFK